MAVLSNVSPLTAHCLSPQPEFASRPFHVGKFILGLVISGCFTGYTGFLQHGINTILIVDSIFSLLALLWTT